MNAIDNARAALEAWDDPDHDAWYDRNLIDPPHMVVNALRDLIAEYERVTAPIADDEREALAYAIARTMGGWNDDTTEPEHPGWSEALRLAAERHWEMVNEECLRQGREYADAAIAAGFRRRGPITDATVEAALQALGHSRSGVTTPRMRAALKAAEAAR